MSPVSFSALSLAQREIITLPPVGGVFLEGPAGSGKTTVGVERLLYLLDQGVPANQILLFLPQRTLISPYQQALAAPGLFPGGLVEYHTIGSLAQRTIDLFWPLVAESAGFARPDLPPTFLNLETAQYYMAHVVRPLLQEGFFDSVVIDRNRLYSQILDNLNKAAMVGFAHTEIAGQLKSAWVGEVTQLRVYEDAQNCASLFRQYCYDHNLLDFSLQVELFSRLLFPHPQVRSYLFSGYRHLIADNVEENPPAAHDLLREWLPEFDSSLLIYDWQAGYRYFLGADPQEGYNLHRLAAARHTLEEQFVSPPQLQALGESLTHYLDPSGEEPGQPAPGAQLPPPPPPGFTADDALTFDVQRFYPDMLDWVAGQIAELVFSRGLPPGEIAVLSPFLSDSLRFALTQRLSVYQVPVRSYRPSRALREEPATRCLLTLAALAHPAWGFFPARQDFAHALLSAIDGIDLVRASLFAQVAFQIQDGTPHLLPFERFDAEMRERVSFTFGEQYDRLRLWLVEYAEGTPAELDHFLSRLFGEILSQPGFGFHVDFKAGEVAANLITSMRNFRLAVGPTLAAEGINPGREYLHMVQDGVIAAQYVRSWEEQPADAVYLAPAYTFLLQNRPVSVQFWLDVGGRSWFERILQPVTHPYVLSRHWQPGRPWTQLEEDAFNRGAMLRLALGLLRRCRDRVYLGLSQLNEQGYESRGPLLRALDRVLRSIPLPPEESAP